MLNRKDVIEKLESKYHPMINQISIPDFYKCIARFSGLRIQDVSDDAMLNYLTLWTKNKYRFFEMMGNKVRIDTPFDYENVDKNVSQDYKDLSKEFVVYMPWLNCFSNHKENKIDVNKLSWDAINLLDNAFPNLKREGMAITRFLKSYLNAPDELVTKVAAIYENEKISATHTISIDPVDMMLASENPYDWRSCYKLDTYDSDSHADGCLAAILDSSSLITYVWNNEGEFTLKDSTFSFKSIRYKRMRGWISIDNTFKYLHFNAIYPGKFSYPEELLKRFRDIVETLVAKHNGFTNKWRKLNSDNYYCSVDCWRDLPYGYGEYSHTYIYIHESVNEETRYQWNVYDENIICPCGCGSYLPGSDDNDGIRYNGDGFIAENFSEEYWCESADDYCSCQYGSYECRECGCGCWRNDHPVCELDHTEECDSPDWYNDNVDDGIAFCTPEHCATCPLYKLHHPEEESEEIVID